MISQIYSPQTGLAGSFDYLRETETLLAGQVYARFTVLGKITIGAITSAAGTNTGTETIGSLAAKSKTKIGAYTLKCTAAGATGTFSVVDPDGYRLGDATIGTAYSNNQIGFTITAGGTAAAVGDSFTITVAAGSGKFKLVNSANVDGSQNPAGVLAETMDASASDRTAQVYKTGEFAICDLTFGGTDTYQTHQDALRTMNIYLRTVMQ